MTRHVRRKQGEQYHHDDYESAQECTRVVPQFKKYARSVLADLFITDWCHPP